MFYRIIGIIFGGVFLLSSCTKSAGVGGKASITGKVFAHYVEEGSFDTLEFSGYADQKVYIVYGDGSIQDDDTRTSPDGSFKFEYLNPGDYTVFTYSETLNNQSEMTPVYSYVTVNKSQDDAETATLEVVEYVK
jgi:hypothetical protein